MFSSNRDLVFADKISTAKILFTPKKTERDVKKVKIVKAFKKIRTIAIFMRKDVPNPGKLVW